MRPHATICIVGMTAAGEAWLEFREHPEPSMTIGDLQEMRRAKIDALSIFLPDGVESWIELHECEEGEDSDEVLEQ